MRFIECCCFVQLCTRILLLLIISSLSNCCYYRFYLLRQTAILSVVAEAEISGLPQLQMAVYGGCCGNYRERVATVIIGAYVFAATRAISLFTDISTQLKVWVTYTDDDSVTHSHHGSETVFAAKLSIQSYISYLASF